MKWIYAPLTLVVLMAGVYFGLQDYRRSLDRPHTVPTEQVKPPTVVPGEEPGTPEPIRALDLGALRDRVQAALADFDDRVEQDRLDRAATAAIDQLRAIARDLGPAIDADPRGLEALRPLRIVLARARLYDAIEGLERSDELPVTFYRVKLANGNTLTARRADLENNRYEIETVPHGIIFTLDREKVDAVVAVDRKDYLQAEWNSLSSRLEGLKDPVDLYVRGVSKCVSLGLRKEGFRLLDRILDAPDAAGVIDVVFLDASPTFRHLWAQAAGVAPLPPVPGIRSTRPAEIARPEDPGPAPREPDPRATEPSPESTSISPDELATRLAEIARLRDEAAKIYRDAISGETELSTLSGARTRLERARDLIRSLPPGNSTVRSTKDDVFGLLHAVIKAQPF